MNSELRQISTDEITNTVKRLCIESNTILGDDMLRAIRKAHQIEESAVGKDIFNQFLKTKWGGMRILRLVAMELWFREFFE